MIYFMQEKNSQLQDPMSSLEDRNSLRCETISFNYVLRLSKILSRKIRGSGYVPDIIVAIGRGGYVPGRLISDLLLFNNLISMRIEHYARASEMRQESNIRFPISVDITGKKVLIVDDLTDTGDTLNLAVNYIWSLKPAEVRTAVLQHKNCSTYVPDFYAQKIIKWRWIIYPWARYEDIAGFIEKIILNRTLDILHIISEFKTRYYLDIKKKELLEILDYLTEKGEIECIDGNIPSWRVSRDNI